MAEVNYILEVERSGAIVRAFPLPLVNRYSHDLDASERLRWTLGRVPVEERSGVRGEPIRLEGSSGLQPRRGTSRTGAPMFGSGPELFKELEAFLRDFKNEAARFDGISPGFVDPAAKKRKNLDQNTSLVLEPPSLRLIFRALVEGHDLYVQLGNFSFDRSASTDNFTYSWTLSLTAWGVATPKQPPVVGSLAQAYKAIDRAVNAVSMGVATADAYLDRADGVRRQFEAPLRALSRLATTTRGLASTVQTAAAWPRDLVVDALNVASEGTVAAFEVWAALPFTSRPEAREAMTGAVGAIAEVRNRASEALGAAFIRTGSADSSRSQRLASTQGTLVARYEVQPGDTLASIARKFTGDRARSVEIAALNGIADPSTGPFGQPLRPGVEILVPVSGDAGATPVDPGDLFGTDFLVGPDGDFVLEGDDVALVSGLDNLSQGLRHRLTSRQGDSPLNPSWGLPDGPGDALTAESEALAVSRTRGQILADPRIASVPSCLVETERDARLVKCRAITVGGGAARLTVPLAAGA